MLVVTLGLLLSACDAPDLPRAPEHAPGAPTAARLTRTSFDRVVHDLLGTPKTPGRMFPEDETAFGFDVVGSALTTTATHVEAWEGAAADLADELFGLDPEVRTTWTVEAEGAGVSYVGEGELVGQGIYGIRQGGLATTVLVPDDGTFELRVLAIGNPFDGEAPRLEVRLDERFVAEPEVPFTEGTGWVAVEVELTEGAHRIELGLANPSFGAGPARSLGIDKLELDGPLDPEGAPTAARDRFVPCAEVDRPCAADALAAFAGRAWRRPPSAGDVDWALSTYDAATALGEPPDGALALAFEAVLLAPDFLFRLEPGPPPGEAVRALDGAEVATRLAAFLWSSHPDDALLALAEAGDLDRDAVRGEVHRMLGHPRAAALVDDFAGQWLDIRALDEVAPDLERYPTFDEPLRASMKRQLSLVAEDFLAGRTDLVDLVGGTETWIDARLAEHLGTPFDGEEAWVRTEVPDRVGVLGTPGWLTVHAHPDRASAVQRGRWVLEDLLCTPPAPPPPDVMAVVVLEPDAGSARAQEEAMRADPTCQACHTAIDGIGFVLHGYDAIGASRETDELGYPIDASTDLAGDPAELADWITARSGLPACVARQTLVYALGRALTDADDPLVDEVTAAFVAGGLRFDALAEAVAVSDAFLYRGRP